MQPLEQTEAMISSLMDTWILAAFDTIEGRRHRNLYVLKSRGMSHSDDVRPFHITSKGIQLQPPRNAKQARSAPRRRK
jgi:circadian clock protein KaiC